MSTVEITRQIVVAATFTVLLVTAILCGHCLPIVFQFVIADLPPPWPLALLAGLIVCFFASCATLVVSDVLKGAATWLFLAIDTGLLFGVVWFVIEVLLQMWNAPYMVGG